MVIVRNPKSLACAKEQAESWLSYHQEVPVIAEYLKGKEPSPDHQACYSELEFPAGEFLADFQLEDQRTEVFLHWTLPKTVVSKDLEIKIEEDQG